MKRSEVRGQRSELQILHSWLWLDKSALVRHSPDSPRGRDDGGFCIPPASLPSPQSLPARNAAHIAAGGRASVVGGCAALRAGLHFCLAAAILGFCGCGTKKDTAAEEAIPVRCVRVAVRDIKRTLDYASSIKAQDDALVYPKVTGKIAEKLKEEGAEVNKGEAIAYIDRDEIGLKFEKSPVDSPLTGVIGAVYVDKGESVSPQTPVAFVVNFDNVRVSLGVPEKYLPGMVPGQLAEISVDAFAEQTFTGKVSKVSPVVDLQTRTASVEIFIPNPGHVLKPGMFARVKLVLEEKKGVKLIPKEAALGKAPEIIVYIVELTVAHQRKVKLGMREGGEVEVIEGVKAGERVVIMGQSRLRDGAEVIVEEESPAQKTNR